MLRKYLRKVMQVLFITNHSLTNLLGFMFQGYKNFQKKEKRKSYVEVIHGFNFFLCVCSIEQN